MISMIKEEQEKYVLFCDPERNTVSIRNLCEVKKIMQKKSASLSQFFMEITDTYTKEKLWGLLNPYGGYTCEVWIEEFLKIIEENRDRDLSKTYEPFISRVEKVDETLIKKEKERIFYFGEVFYPG